MFILASSLSFYVILERDFQRVYVYCDFSRALLLLCFVQFLQLVFILSYCILCFKISREKKANAECLLSKGTHCVNRLSGHKGLEKTLFLMVSKIPKGILCFLLIFFSFMILFTSDFSLGGQIMGPHLEFHKMLCLVTITQDLSYEVYHGYVRWLSRSRCCQV